MKKALWAVVPAAVIGAAVAVPALAATTPTAPTVTYVINGSRIITAQHIKTGPNTFTEKLNINGTRYVLKCATETATQIYCGERKG